MDSDDIALPNRLDAQASFLQKNLNVDVLATLTEEFVDDDTARTHAITKTCPQSHFKIRTALKLSNCVANPTLLLKKEYWNKVGGFPDFRDINEDYLFFLRLISAGATFACLQVPLVRVRISQKQRNRRLGYKLYQADIRFRFLAYREGHLSMFWVIFPLILIAVRRFVPTCLNEIVHATWRKTTRFIH
jgi:hypothetical protein